MTHLLKLDSISKIYSSDEGLNVSVLEDISLEIEERGKIITFLAPFGSGKTTLLKIIAGLIEPSGGKIFYDDSNKLKRIPYLPEKPSSYPWLNVRQNIELASNLFGNKFNSEEFISLVGLKDYEDYFPNNKSLGFRFRISLARALAINPSLILIDDSFKRMSNESRIEIYALLKELASDKKFSVGFILATTNLVEAIQLSDIIFLMGKKPGRIIKKLKIDVKDKVLLADSKSEKFTMLKNEIEEAFNSLSTVTTINYSL